MPVRVIFLWQKCDFSLKQGRRGEVGLFVVYKSAKWRQGSMVWVPVSASLLLQCYVIMACYTPHGCGYPTPPYLLRSQKMTLDNPLSYPGHSLLLHRPSIITSSWQSLKQVLNLFCFLSVLAFIPHKNSLITFNENIFYVTLSVTCLLKCSFGANLLQLKTSWELLFPHFYYLNKSNFFAQLSRALRNQFQDLCNLVWLTCLVK